jgi:hypothetical protein
VRCVRERLTESQVASLGPRYYRSQSFHIRLGKEYVVIGLTFAVDSNVHGTGVWVHLVNDDGVLIWAPLTLFEVTDRRVSKHWVARVFDKGLNLWPPSLFKDSYHEDLADGVQDVEEDFQRVLASLEREAREPADGAAGL